MTMTHAEQAYQHADKAIQHYTRLIAGHLSPAQRRGARIQLVKMVFARAAARKRIEREVVIDEMVAA